jgi:hypothetical protein
MRRAREVEGQHRVETERAEGFGEPESSLAALDTTQSKGKAR